MERRKNTLCTCLISEGSRRLRQKRANHKIVDRLFSLNLAVGMSSILTKMIRGQLPLWTVCSKSQLAFSQLAVKERKSVAASLEHTSFPFSHKNGFNVHFRYFRYR
jgi:hypothetical protein